MTYYDHIKDGAIVAKRQAQNSSYVKNLLGTGNPELLTTEQIEAVGLHVRVRPDLESSQTYTGAVVITDPLGTADGVRELTVADGWADLEAARSTATLSAWGIRTRLDELGWRIAVETAVAGADQKTKDGWDKASPFERLHPLIQTVATAIGKTEADLDILFGI